VTVEVPVALASDPVEAAFAPWPVAVPTPVVEAMTSQIAELAPAGVPEPALEAPAAEIAEVEALAVPTPAAAARVA